MEISLPTSPVTLVFDNLPSGLVGSGTPIAVQIQKLNGTIVLGRTVSGITEQVAGSGIYVVTFAAPSEQGDYIVIVDWNGGSPTPTTSKAIELQVSSNVAITSSGLGVIADAAKGHMGTIFDALVDSSHYGSARIANSVEVIKQRLLNTPPATVNEGTLHPLVIDFLGKLVALDLMPAAYDLLADQYQSHSIGNDPAELVTYPDRLKVLQAIEQRLLAQVARERSLINPLLVSPRLLPSNDLGPGIDEVDDCRVTADPRERFPIPPAHEPSHRTLAGIRRWG